MWQALGMGRQNQSKSQHAMQRMSEDMDQSGPIREEAGQALLQCEEDECTFMAAEELQEGSPRATTRTFPAQDPEEQTMEELRRGSASALGKSAGSFQGDLRKHGHPKAARGETHRFEGDSEATFGSLTRRLEESVGRHHPAEG